MATWALALGYLGHPGRASGADAKQDEKAESTDSQWLVWRAPPECPPSSAIEAQVRAWVSGEISREEMPQVDATVTANAEGWTVHIVVSDGNGGGERHVSTATCADAAQLVAIAAALALAPDNKSIPLGEPAPDPVAPRREDAASKANSPQGAPGTPQEPPTDEPTTQQKGTVPWFAGVGTLLGSGLLPGARTGLTLDGGVRWGHLGVSLGALWFPAAATEVPGTAPVDLTAVGGGVAFGYLWDLQSISLGPSFGGEAGAIIADQQGDSAARSPTSTPWVTLLLGGRARLPRYKSVRAVVGADFLVPLVRPDLILSDGTPVYRTDVGVRGLLEISFESDPAQ